MENKEIKIENIKSIGKRAREKHSILGSLDINGENVYGSCIEISSYIKNELINHGLPKNSLSQVRCKLKGEVLHYIVSVKSKHIQDIEISEDRIFIDASLDQFCKEQKENNRVNISFGNYNDIPKVDIIKPSNKEKSQKYKNRTKL